MIGKGFETQDMDCVFPKLIVHVISKKVFS